jgi:tetratricopeptide (TPR) repeat protein
MQERSDRLGSRAVLQYRQKHFPEEQLMADVRYLISAGNWSEAKTVCERAIKLNPMFSRPWSQLGRALTALQQYDSAIAVLEIANGLNPGSPFVLSGLGTAYYRSGDLDAAERVSSKVLSLDATQLEPTVTLARVYQARGDRLRYLHYLQRATTHDKAPGTLLKELGDIQLEDGQYQEAAESYSQALAKGLEPSDVTLLLERYPELRRWMNR